MRCKLISFDDETPHREEPTFEELEDRAAEDRRQHEEEMGRYYKGIWQGLLLGIFGNLLVSFLIEFLKEWISEKWWFLTNAVGLVVVTIITGLIGWKMFLTAESYSQGKFYTDHLKERGKGLTKIAIISVAIILVIYGLRLFNDIAHNVLPKHNLTYEMAITELVSIDFLGGILPAIISIVFLFCLIAFKQIRLKSYIIDFILLLALSFPFSYPTLNALEVNYVWVSFIVSLFAVYRMHYKGIISYVFESIKKRKMLSLKIKWLKALNSQLLAFSYASFVVLSLDLTFLVLIHIFSTDVTMYIGGSGLVDAIVLAPLTTPFFVVSLTLLQLLIKNLLKLFSKQNGRRGYRPA